jgi:hypothetical protein
MAISSLMQRCDAICSSYQCLKTKTISRWLPLILVEHPEHCEIPKLSRELRYSAEQQNSTTLTGQRHHNNKLQTSKPL